MEMPTLEKLNQVRKEGFRPGVVACIVNQKRVLLFYKEEYKLWMLPQGGIENGQDPIEALKKTLSEELGSGFSDNLKYNEVIFLDTDRMEFKPGRHSLKKMEDENGQEITMIGKEYYFCVIPSSKEQVSIKETVYDDYFWLNYKEASFIADRIYQKGKRRVTLKILDRLYKESIIS